MEIIKAIIDFIIHIDKHLIEIVSEYKTWTYLILFLIIFAETGFVITPFLPGDSLLFAIGALISTGGTGLNVFFMTFLLCTAAILGNTTNYYAGNYLGVKVFKQDNKILKLEYYVKTQLFFNKHGGKAVIFSRFIPIIRTVAPFVAGVGKMGLAKYTLYNIIGGVLWVVSFIVLGYLFGNLPVIKENFTIAIFVIILVSVLPALVPIAKEKFKKTD